MNTHDLPHPVARAVYRFRQLERIERSAERARKQLDAEVTRIAPEDMAIYVAATTRHDEE